MNNIRFMEIAPDEKHELRMDAQSHFGTFEVKDDATLYEKVNKLAHSTFDRSKFTVVGSPTITDDGIASGFSSSNYLTTSQTISGIWKCTALVNCTNGEEDSFGNGIFSGSNSSTEVFYVGIRNRRLQVHLGNIYNDRPTTPIFENNVNYLFELGFTGAKYYLKINNNEVLSIDSTTPLTNVGNIQIGTRAINRSAYFKGSIDLKQFSITVDGKEVFNGNKEGLDVIKPDNYTVVGSPTITEDGVASGFSSSAYLKHSIIKTGNSVKIKIRIKTSTLDGNTRYVLRGLDEDLPSGASAMGLLISNTNKLWLVGYTSSGAYTNVGNYIINADTEYLIEAEYASNKITYKVNNTDVATISGSYKLPKSFSLGNSFSSDAPFAGSIDLNLYRIYVDGQLVYQPCLKIPYKEGQNYVKVVDELYRDRVKDLFEQKGYNGYYTIGEDDFTLPSNKWSDVIEHKENGLTVAEQRVDQTLTIRGACEQGVDVNLPMEFFSVDSYAVFGVGTTGTNTASKFTPAADGNYIAIGKGKV